MKMRRRRPQKRAGISLIEVAICTALVGVLIVGAMSSVGAVLRGRMATGESIRAGQLATQRLTEIQAQAYLEPEEAPLFGVETGENAAARTTWDDVDDYHLWSASPPQDRNGVPLPGTTGWQRDVTVEWADAADPSSNAGSDQGVKRITVTVQRNGQVVAQEMAIRSDKYSAN